MRWGMWKVDWPNHLIGFFSALFGILIAFELDEWREAKNHRDDAHNAFQKVKQEIGFNKNLLHETVNRNLQLLDLLEVELLPYVNEALVYSGSLTAAKTINSKVTPVARIILSDSVSSVIREPILINLGSFLRPTFHYSAWESAKATGIINYIDYEKVLTISSLYNTSILTDELLEIRILLRQSDEITTKARLKDLLMELRESHLLVQSELIDYDVFTNIIDQME